MESMKRTVDEVRATMYDKDGAITTSGFFAVEYRISVFIDHFSDNHHIQFHKTTDRIRVVTLLHELANRVELGASYGI